MLILLTVSAREHRQNGVGFQWDDGDMENGLTAMFFVKTALTCIRWFVE